MWIKEDKHVCGVEQIRDMVQVRDNGGLADGLVDGEQARKQMDLKFQL